MRAQVVLVRDGRILLASHRTVDRVYWVLPGGAVEAGETPEDAAIREVREETGLDIELDRLLFVDEPRCDGQVSIRSPRYTYAGHICGGELLQISEIANCSCPNGHLAGVSWMPFESDAYDSGTRDTLDRVKVLV